MICFESLVLIATLFPLIDAPQKEAPSKDLQQFQGAWQARSVVDFEGKSETAEELAQTRLVVTGDRFRLTGKGYTITGRLMIDPTQTLKTIDVLIDSGAGKPPTRLLGIYRIDGDIRRSCFAMPDAERPRAFPAAPRGFLQLEWKRAADARAPGK